MFKDLFGRLGYVPEDEALLRSLPASKIKRIEDSPLQNIEFMAQMNKASQEINYLRTEIDSLEKSLQGVQNVSVGYDRSGSILRTIYPTPNQLYTFIGEKYWAASRCRKYSRMEFERDGYVLIASSKTSNRDIKRVYKALDELDISRFAGDAFDHIKIFSNFWATRERVPELGANNDINLLVPERLQPLYFQDDLLGWEYKWNGVGHRLPVDYIDHVKTYALNAKQLGEPVLSSIVVDIEADLHASVFNNTLWQKGGLIKALVSLETYNQEGIVNTNEFLSLAKKLQELFTRQFAGVRGGGGLLFSPLIKAVHNIVNPKDLEGAYSGTSEKTAIKCAELLGCPPEVLGFSRTSQYVNKASVLDFSSLAVDNDNYYVAGLVYQYITNMIIKDMLGVDNVIMQQRGEFGAVSPAAATIVFQLSQAGCDFMTVNDARVRLFHWEPLLGPEGEQFLGKYKNEAMLQKAANTNNSQERTQALEEVFGKREQSIIISSRVDLTRHYPSEIRFY